MPFDSLPELDKVDLLLYRARSIVESGWCKRDLFVGNHEKHCILGAIQMANKDVYHWTTYRKAVARFADTLPARTYYPRMKDHRTSELAIMDWNDRKSRRKGQVLKQFDKVLSKVNAET